MDVINMIHASPYISRAGISDQLNISKPTVDNRIREIKEQIKAGRYNDLAVIKDGGVVLVNYLVFIDYMANRQKLLEKNLARTVPAFRPKKVAESIGWYE